MHWRLAVFLILNASTDQKAFPCLDPRMMVTDNIRTILAVLHQRATGHAGKLEDETIASQYSQNVSKCSGAAHQYTEVKKTGYSDHPANRPGDAVAGKRWDMERDLEGWVSRVEERQDLVL